MFIMGITVQDKECLPRPPPKGELLNREIKW
jgi:hypothetical protein